MGIDIAIRVERELVECGGEMSVEKLKSLYDAKGDGQRVNARLIKTGRATWVRDHPTGSAKSIRLLSQDA